MNIKKSILYYIILLPILIYSQSYIGLHADNYNGVHGVIFNPANITDSNFKTDINIISASICLENDYISINTKDLFNGGNIDFEDKSNQNLSENNNFAIVADVLGPSFMMNINTKQSIALFTRVRGFGNVNGINGKLYERFTDDNFDSSESFTVSDDGFKNMVHGWGEIGVSYASILIDKDQHFLKGGLSLKYLQGLGSGAIQSKDVFVNYDSNIFATTQEIDTQGELTITSTFNKGYDFEVHTGDFGLGIDFGFIYEWRPKLKDSVANKYKLKFGIAVTDIGSIKYNNVRYEKFITNGININESIFEDNDFEDALDILAAAGVYTKTESSRKTTTKLPTALHIQADWNIIKKWYLNFNSDLSLTDKNAENTNNIVTKHYLTPRYETKWFTAQMPITTSSLKNTTVGFGFRAGPLYVGSGSILTNMMSKNSKALDIYFGLKIPIYK